MSTYRNWVGPSIGKPSDPAFDKACWRKAFIMDTCPYGFDYNTKTCWAQCPMAYPVECGFECLRQNDDCGSEIYAKFVSVANAFFSVQILGVFGAFAKLSKNVRVGIKCARAMFGTMRAIVNYIRAIKVSDPQTPQDKILLALYQTSYVTIDLPVSIVMCMGRSYNWQVLDPASVAMGTIQTYGVIVDDLIDKGKSDNGTSLTAKQYTRVVADKVLMTIATLFYVDLTRISGLLSEYIQTICGPTQLVGEIDDGTDPNTLGLRTVGKAFANSGSSWERRGDGVVKITFMSTDTKDVTVNILSGGDKFDEKDVPAGKTVTWTSTVKELGGKTLYLDRWRPGFLGLPGTGGGSLKLWVPRASEGGHLEITAKLNRSQCHPSIMAPNHADSINTPRVDAVFSSLKTPDVEDKRSVVGEPRLSNSPSSSNRFSIVGNVLQLLIVASMVTYAYGQLFYFTDAYSDLSTTIGKWFGVPPNAPKDSDDGHKEMIRPTFFFLFCFLPIAASLVFLEVLKHFNVRRITSHYLLNFTRVLRRKPSIFGWVARVSLGELLFLAFLVGGNVYVFHYYYMNRVERNRQRGREFNFELYLEMVALTLGFVCIYNMAFLFLPATRNCVWMEFLNISYANGIKYHRWVGVITVLTALFHCLGYYWSWIRQDEWKENALPCFDCAVGSKEGHDPWMNFFGEIALLAFLAIGLTSIPWVRRKMYNTFYNVHHLFLIGTIFAVLHWNPILAWIFPSVMLYTVSRAISSSNGFTPVAVREFMTLSHDVVKVVLSRSTAPADNYKVGQFVYLNVPTISKLQWHAFTIASSPRTSPDALTILLKSLGDWTEDLVKYSEDCKKNNVLPTMYMDGYYGASLEMYDEYSTVCLVGGGIGVTPLLSILEDIVAKLQKGETLRQKVIFIFSFRELSLLEEIHPVLMQIKELDPQQQYFSLHFSLTRAPTTEQLDELIDRERLAGKPHVSATKYDSSVTSKTPRPFTEPLRTRTSKVMMFGASFLVTLIVVLLVKYGNKVQVDDENLWPLQNFVEISLLIAVGMITVYTSVALDKKTHDPKTNTSRNHDMLETPRLPSIAADVHTFQNLISEYNVDVGRRPNIPELIESAFVEHRAFSKAHPSSSAAGNKTIGVFVSGPEELKKAVEYAIAEIGSKHFDVHEEEFEL
ncbi:hypothetical protein JG688_00011138 [Phytophthora aleatoria]|uniref:FAD-binding FR-type domain-containing protein n=1 Tax=Phytophthora aleatoria TaxID=2496075 RepID=A0A8J5M5G4_9STRA|nr:hypothetical protein JG688_00011138 [Phytophthora aleatoria]